MARHPLAKGPPSGTMKINFLSLSPNCTGERVRVRGYLADILYITPHLYPLPSRGEEYSGDLFLSRWKELIEPKKRLISSDKGM